ncbi:MAG: sporulation protein YabP [Clostridiales bacterium]
MDKQYVSTITGREKIVLAGVKEINEFDDQQIIAESNLGMVELRGKQLKITQLDQESEELTVEGKISSLTYSEKKTGERSKSLLKKLIG